MGWPLTSAATTRPQCRPGVPLLNKVMPTLNAVSAYVRQRPGRPARRCGCGDTVSQGSRPRKRPARSLISGPSTHQGRGGLPKDEREAARLYKLAADQGNAGRQVNLGFLYAQGLGGLPKDEHEAARLYKLAADQGNALGQANLGNFY